MAEFDPDAYLASPPAEKAEAKPEFDPDAYLAQPPKDRGVLERAGSEVAGAFKSGVQHAKELVTKPTGGDLWESAKTVGKAALSPLEIIGAPLQGVESLATSGMEKLTGLLPGQRQTSEQRYEYLRPQVGLAFSAAGPARGKVPAVPGVRPAERVAEEIEAAKPAAVAREEGARKIIEKKATDIEKVKQELEAPQELVPGSKPTTFQLTQDQGLGQLERGASQRSPELFVGREGEQHVARQQAFEGVQPTGSPSDLATHLRTTLAAEESEATRAVTQAQQRAWEAAQRPGGTYDPTTYGNIFRREVQQAEDVARARERALWQAVDPQGALQANPQRIQELERNVYGSMTEAGAASITPAEKQIADLIQGYRPVVPFRELTDLRSLTSTALRDELYNRGQTPAYARLSRLRQGIEDAVMGAFDEAGQAQAGAAERLRAASAATRERAETFRPLREVTRREGTQGPYRMGEATVPGRIVQPGPKGYDSASAYLRAVGNERGLPDVQDSLAATMRQKAIGPDGMVDPKKLDTWIRQNEGTLRAISERDGGAFVQRVRDAGQAQRLVKQAEAKLASVSAQQENEALKGVLGATDDETIARNVGSLLGRADAPARMRELVGKARSNPDALAGLRRSVIDHMRATLTSNAPVIGEEVNKIRAEQFQNFMKSPTRVAALREVLEPDQVKTLQNIAADIRQMNTSVSTKLRGGSDTAQNLFQATLLAAAEFVVEHALTGFLMPPVLTGTKYGLKGLKYAAGYKQMKVSKVVDRAMASPEYARQLLSRTTQRAARPGIVPTAIEAGNVGNVIPNQTNNQPAPRQTGGGVPAIGGTGGRSKRACSSDCACETCKGTSKALQDGGAAGNPAGKPGSRERFLALISGSTGAGGSLGSPSRAGKGPTATQRKDIIDMLRRHGVEDLGGFGESMTGS